MAFVTNTLVLFLAATALISVAAGFSIDLLHRDSPDSPLYNPLETRAERLQNAAMRTIGAARHRIDRLRPATSGGIATPLVPDTFTAEYLIKLSVGTPSFPIVAIIDTGSDVIWTQCKPCRNCFKQIAPMFDPKKSSTYTNLRCSSKMCSTALTDRIFCRNGDVCAYSVGYGDMSHTTGNLAMETLTLNTTTGSPFVLRNTVMGCGHNNNGTFAETLSGIVGLGGGPASLVSQMGSSISGRFAYCLPPFESRKPSELSFGPSAIVTRGVRTPLFIDKEDPTFYALQLDAISVGKVRIPFPNVGGGSKRTGVGNIVIDSGTSLTLIPGIVMTPLMDAVNRLQDAVDSQVRGGTPSQVEGMAPCYNDLGRLIVPNVTMHFQGGDVVLTRMNTFVEAGDNVYCFAFVETDSIAIYGNVAQHNFLVGYDIKERSVTFKPKDCTA
ncbi:Aspartic proteinase CDR1 [Linum grandiflorum]